MTERIHGTFKSDLWKELWLSIPQNFNIVQLYDCGFIRFDKEKLHALYPAVVFKKGVTGFVKYVYKDKKFTPHSVYIKKSDTEEDRLDLKGKLICRYTHHRENGVLVIWKMKDGVRKEKYLVDRKDVFHFPELYKILKKKNIIEKEDDRFHYFRKGKYTIYLNIENYN